MLFLGYKKRISKSLNLAAPLELCTSPKVAGRTCTVCFAHALGEISSVSDAAFISWRAVGNPTLENSSAIMPFQNNRTPLSCRNMRRDSCDTEGRSWFDAHDVTCALYISYVAALYSILCVEVFRRNEVMPSH